MIINTIITSVAAIAMSLNAASASTSEAHLTEQVGLLPSGPEISKSDILVAQKMWGNAVVAIGKAGDEAKTVAEESAKAAYAFDLGFIQFKPTLAAEKPFRSDLEGALSYFVSGNDKYTEDKGFALKPWSKVRFDNDTVKLKDNIAIAMGHYYFTGPDGSETKVEYTKGYVKMSDGSVKIFLQDSSLPFDPAKG